MLKPITILDLLKLFMQYNCNLDDIVMLASDEEGNSFGHLQPELFSAELKDGRHAVILFPYAEGVYEDFFKANDLNSKHD
jgi:hypothetical protein